LARPPGRRRPGSGRAAELVGGRASAAPRVPPFQPGKTRPGPTGPTDRLARLFHKPPQARGRSAREVGVVAPSPRRGRLCSARRYPLAEPSPRPTAATRRLFPVSIPNHSGGSAPRASPRSPAIPRLTPNPPPRWSEGRGTCFERLGAGFLRRRSAEKQIYGGEWPLMGFAPASPPLPRALSPRRRFDAGGGPNPHSGKWTRTPPRPAFVERRWGGDRSALLPAPLPPLLPQRPRPVPAVAPARGCRPFNPGGSTPKRASRAGGLRQCRGALGTIRDGRGCTARHGDNDTVLAAIDRTDVAQFFPLAAPPLVTVYRADHLRLLLLFADLLLGGGACPYFTLYLAPLVGQPVRWVSCATCCEPYLAPLPAFSIPSSGPARHQPIVGPPCLVAPASGEFGLGKKRNHRSTG